MNAAMVGLVRVVCLTSSQHTGENNFVEERYLEEIKTVKHPVCT